MQGGVFGARGGGYTFALKNLNLTNTLAYFTAVASVTKQKMFGKKVCLSLTDFFGLVSY
jgi:hypothetical protein